ncbi:MAG TPA: DNA topoisomerase I [Candidatus Pacearchaeota archaeon]|nr:DNA topoisomerase I [Candidatus Pacearchaeota archaeon]
MLKKKKKSQEEKLAEDFFPIDEDNLRYAIEKKYKKPDPGLIEKVERKVKKKISPKKKKTSKRKKVSTIKGKKKEFSTPKIKLKKDGYELIITEKPQAALKISSALGKSTKRDVKGVPYYEVDRKGIKIVVACAVGHLFTLSQKKARSEAPVFDISWVPNSFVKKTDFSKKYYDVLSKLAKGAGSLTVATDYDVEGEVIGLNIVRFIAGQKDASRMKFSTLTAKDIEDSYESKSKSIDWGQAIAGETRHYLDWFYGINLSRALMNAIKTTGSFRIMSIGRVQGPALNLVVNKEKEIESFKSKPYWQIFIKTENPELELIHNRDIFDKGKLKEFENLKGKTGKAETKKTQKNLPPNPPFNLTTLQTEAYRIHNINPGRTLSAAQSLYLAGLISYPRTSSQKLPPSINYKEILKKLEKKYGVEKLLTRKKPLEGKKGDPAHPSIYPTGNTKVLEGDEKKIYELIVKRFLSLFMEDAIVENKRISVDVANERKVEGQGNLGVLTFGAKGSAVQNASWLQIYPSRIKEKEIPDLEGEVTVADSRIEEKETQPPKRFSPASILSELEKRNLGTKATRSAILETLYNRNYIKDQSIKATPLGMSLINTLEKHSPIIIDEALTRDFEKDMESIQQAKKDFIEKEEKTIEKAKDTLRKISKQFNSQINEIGKELLDANVKLREQQREENKLNQCPKCKKGNLGIMYSKKTRRYFVACDAYPDCKNTSSLPPNGLIKKTEGVCEQCGYPKLMRISKGKRPWVFCFNPECITNKERVDAYKKKKEAENDNS